MVIQADSHESGLFLQFSKFFGEGLMQGFFWRVWKGERILLVFAILVFSFQGLAQPAGYYDSADGLSGTELQQALHDIIDNHTSQTYTYLWTAFQSTDKKDNGYVWDMYSDIPGGSPVYNYTFVTDQCGSYGIEGDCYNREHSFPKSWFNDASPMYTDLFHLYPTDGYVNGRRNNYPYGETDHPTWSSSNGSKLGPCDYPGYSGTVFEPIDNYKGDLARTYFYMATRYYGEDAAWPGSDMVDGSQPKEWALTLLMEWHTNDPVSTKELDRNDAVFAIQKNRNPYIDHPEYVDLVWGGVVIPKDTLAPVVDSVQVADAGHIIVWFNEILDNTTSLLAANYAISGGVSVSSVGYNGLQFNSVELVVDGLGSGDYTLTVNGVADEDGNTVENLEFQFNSDIQAVRDYRKLLSVFPNPAHDRVEIRLSDPGDGASEFRLLTLAGQELRAIRTESTESTFQMDISGLKPGYYLLKCRFSDGSLIIPLLIQ